MVAHGKNAGRRRRVWQAAMLTASVWACLAPEPAAAAAAGRGGGRGKGYHEGSTSDAYVGGRKLRVSEGAGRAPAGAGEREAAAPPEPRVVVVSGVAGEGRRLRRRRRAAEREHVGRADPSGQAGQEDASRSERQERGGHAAGTRSPPPEAWSTALAGDAARRRGGRSGEGHHHPAPPASRELLRAGGASRGPAATINNGGDSAQTGPHGSGVLTMVFAEDAEAAGAAGAPPTAAGRRDNGVLLWLPAAAAATLEVPEGEGREGWPRRRTQSQRDEALDDAEEWSEEQEEYGDDEDSFGSSGLLALLVCFGLLFCVMEVAKCYFLLECRRRQRWRHRRTPAGTRQMPIASSRVVAPEPPDDGTKDEWVEVVVDGVWMSGDVPGGEGLPSATGYAVAGASHALHDAIEHARRLSPGTGYRAVFAPPTAPPPQPQAEMSEMSRDDVPPRRSPPVSAAPVADMTVSTQR
ncbi:unnamed protein product [Ectocarpus fasciculatus]